MYYYVVTSYNSDRRIRWWWKVNNKRDVEVEGQIGRARDMKEKEMMGGRTHGMDCVWTNTPHVMEWMLRRCHFFFFGIHMYLCTYCIKYVHTLTFCFWFILRSATGNPVFSEVEIWREKWERERERERHRHRQREEVTLVNTKINEVWLTILKSIVDIQKYPQWGIYTTHVQRCTCASRTYLLMRKSYIKCTKEWRI